MPRPELDDEINMTADNRRRLMSVVATLDGTYEVKLKPKRATHSGKQRGYYFACVVKPFFDLLREQDPSINDRLQVHHELVRQVYGTMALKVGKATLRIIPSIKKWDTVRMMEFVDLARQWLWDQCGIPTVDPDPDYWRAKPEPKRVTSQASVSSSPQALPESLSQPCKKAFGRPQPQERKALPESQDQRERQGLPSFQTQELVSGAWPEV